MHRTALVFLLVLAPSFSAQPQTIELTRDNPKTLLNTDSKNYSIYGLRLGMTREEAETILSDSTLLKAAPDSFNPARIYVNYREANKAKGDDALYLIWEPGQTRLSRITVFTSFSDSITPNFRRLLTSEALDRSSRFMKTFIGLPNRSEVTLDVPSIDLKNTTYYYDNIGLEVTHVHTADGDNVVFALSHKKPIPKRRRRQTRAPRV